ncbi:MAG: ferrochelatase [Rubrivivax sp.]
MSTRAEPAYSHGSAPRTAVVLANLGTPDEPTASAVRRYLAEFLGDPRVVEISRLLWWPILHGIILRTRPAQSAAKYASIWTPEGSPLAVWTTRQAQGLQAQLDQRGHHVTVRHAMRYGNPSLPSVLDALKAEGATRILVLPLYPQYAGSTTATVNDTVMRWAQGLRRQPELRFVNQYHDDPGYISALAQRIRAYWQAHGQGDKLLLSFHGVPHRTLERGDPYHCQCHKTARLLGEQLGLAPDRLVVTFQSRFGKAKWLQPYTEPTLIALAQQGLQRVDVACPGFTSDCLETLEEINMEAREAFLHAGGRDFHYIPCLNDSSDWAQALGALAERHLQGWDTRSLPDAAALTAQAARARAMGADR